MARKKRKAKPKVKAPRKLTEKQKVFVKELSTSLDPVGAYQVAYNEPDRHEAGKNANKVMKQTAIKDLMNSPKQGLSDEFLLGRLKRALMAKKLVWSKSAEDWLEEVDWATQVKALEIAFRLKGHLNSKSVDIDSDQVKEINVTFNLVKARSIEEIASLTGDSAIAKGREAVVDKPQEGEVVDGKVVSGD